MQMRMVELLQEPPMLSSMSGKVILAKLLLAAIREVSSEPSSALVE
jgi:hypothetical protein